MWSASSSTVVSTAPRSQARRSIRSTSRPGVATTMSTPRSSALDLLADRQAAGDEAHGQAAGIGERGERVGDLHGQLAGRHEDKAARAARAGRLAVEAGDQRQAEARGSCPSRWRRGRARRARPGRPGWSRPGSGTASRCRGGQRGDQRGRQAELGEAGQVLGRHDLDGQVVPDRVGARGRSVRLRVRRCRAVVWTMVGAGGARHGCARAGGHENPSGRWHVPVIASIRARLARARRGYARRMCCDRAIGARQTGSAYPGGVTAGAPRRQVRTRLVHLGQPEVVAGRVAEGASMP